MHNVILVRFGELSLKGLNRRLFEDTLVENIKNTIDPDMAIDVRKEQGRIVLESQHEVCQPNAWIGRALDAVTRVFGIVSVSAAKRVSLDMDSISAACIDEIQSLEKKPRTFKVETTRANKTFPVNSLEVSRQIGGHILRSMPFLTVDVHKPDVTVFIDIRAQDAYVFSTVVSGPGGLPYGTGGKALLLLSGGIDSPVAGYLTMKRGVTLEAVHFYSHPFTSERSKDKVIDLCRILARYASGKPIALHVVHFTDVQKSIIKNCPADLTITIMRRMMLRISHRVMQRVGALALATGESIGQVASQTLESMHTINAVTSVPVLRPLCGLDKSEIVVISRKIGTYDISIRPFQDCCTLFVPRHPKTKPRPEQAELAEQRLDLDGLIESAVGNIETINIS